MVVSHAAVAFTGPVFVTVSAEPPPWAILRRHGIVSKKVKHEQVANKGYLNSKPMIYNGMTNT